MLGDQVEFDRLAGQPVELAVVRVRARAPEAGTADIGQPRTEVVAKLWDANKVSS
ncbi:transposase family protein (plasmid) [Pseudomonas paraeruginosa]|uniref:Transposase family protein n=1 Tax=Pseudomonas paraeruginosa TaxID=2994495 RepID=A0A2R3ILU1_9PSED|nr:transposase family protein [Pseudomonas paraeruginosa]AWE88895.1 transposase family protein [Pseudomonas paraeruginosa]